MPLKAIQDSWQIALQIPNDFSISCADSSIYKSIFAPNKQEIIQPVYCHKNGLLFTHDSIEWLKTILDESVDLVFADPPYNIKKADWDKFESQEQYIEWSLLWIKEVARILKQTGSLHICGVSEILADLKHPAMQYFKACKWLMWFYKNKANLGNDWGRSHESILHLRKSKYFRITLMMCKEKAQNPITVQTALFYPGI